MTPEVDLEGCDILEAEERAYTGKDGSAKTYRSVMFKYGGRIFKVAADKSLDIAKVTAKAGKKATLTLNMSTFGDSIAPEFKVADIA